jgi:hypothetical protein
MVFVVSFCFTALPNGAALTWSTKNVTIHLGPKGRPYVSPGQRPGNRIPKKPSSPNGAALIWSIKNATIRRKSRFAFGVFNQAPHTLAEER